MFYEMGELMKKEFPMDRVVTVLYIIIFSMFIYYATNLSYIFVLFFVVSSSFIFFCILNEIKTTKYIYLYINVFFVKNILLVYQSVNKNLPMGGEDWINFDYMARSILLNTNGLKDIVLLSDYDLFTKLVALMYRYINSSMLSIYYLIFLASLLLLLFFIKNLKLWAISIKSRNFYGLLLFGLPIEFIFSITFLREIPIQMFLMIGLYFFSKFILEKSTISFISSICFFSFSAMMHAGLIGLVLITPLWFLPVMQDRQMKINLFSVFISILFIFILIKSGILDSLTLKFSNIDNFESLQNATVNVQARGNTSYIYPTGSFISYLFSIPYRVIMFTLSPFPWQFKTIGIIIAFLIDGLYRYYFFYNIVKIYKNSNLYKFDQKEKKYFLFLCSAWIISTLIFALGTQNTGTAIRHRAKLYPIELCILSLYSNLSLVNATQTNTKEKSVNMLTKVHS